MTTTAFTTKPSPEALFSDLFNPDSLLEVFQEKFASTTSKGIDRLSGFQFGLTSKSTLATASNKIMAGQFRFSPFLEVLRIKGRDKPPRLIGIPTVRDRVILHQLNRFLSELYPERVPKSVASTYVREISFNLSAGPHTDTWVCSTDIKTFYDSIKRDRLLKILEKRVKCKSGIRLIKHAILTPIVPKNIHKGRHKDFSSQNGVPQGLAISNILASIYMQDIDEGMAKLDVTYYRYVDDVLMFGTEDAVRNAFRSLYYRLRRRGLSLHPLGSSKTQVKSVFEPFGYLGYTFRLPVITVREATIERFLQSIAAKFSDYTHNKSRRLSKLKYLDEDRLKGIFILELNERITGAISQKRRYGWIAYFNQISDLSLLHRLDAAIEGMFKRMPDFGHKAPLELKKLSRAYFEMKFNPLGGYVRNYDRINSSAEMLTFLIERGRVDPTETLSDAEIKNKYEKYRNHLLATMNADEGSVYG